MKKAIFLFITLITILTIGTVARRTNEEFIFSDSSISGLTFPYSESNPARLDLTQFPGNKITVLHFRAISNQPNHSRCIFEMQFSEEMEWLYRHNYHTLNTEEFYKVLVYGAPVPENSVVITFDNKYTDNYKAAWPYLQQYGFKAASLITAEYISPYRIDWNQYNEMIRKGSPTGNYSVGHDKHSALVFQPQNRELSETNALYYPSGKYNKIILKDISGIGFKLNITAKPDKVSLGENFVLLKQVRVWEGMTIDGFAKLVA